MTWLAPHEGRPRRPPGVSDAAVLLCLTIGVPFRRPLRQTAGMVASPLSDGGARPARVGPLDPIHKQLADEQRVIDDRVKQAAAADEAVRRLMTIPGVGVVTAVCFRHTVDEPTRFTSSSTVGAYLGLRVCPRSYSFLAKSSEH